MNYLNNKIAYYSLGDSKHKTIIFIHGFPYDHTMWNKQISFFSSAYYCVAYDIRGIGNSKTENGQFTMEHFVDDLENLIDELELEKPVICGLSMGGYILFRAAEKFGNKIGALIFCDTKPDADTDEGKLKRAAGIKKIDTEGLSGFIKPFIKNTFAESSIKRMGKEYEEIVKNSEMQNPVGIKGCLLGMATRTDVSAYLPKIKVPVLVLGGDKDSLTPPFLMESFAKKIPNATHVVIPKAGHMSPIENPVFFNQAVEKFLQSI